MITTSPRLDELSPRRNKPPHGRVEKLILARVSLAYTTVSILIPRWTRVNPRYWSKLTSGARMAGVCSQQLEVERTRGVRIAVTDLTSFFPIQPMGDRQLRSCAHFTPQPRHYEKLLATDGNHKCGK
ncbi:hypothetical protein PIB30_016347 [Stylosanthes scabra]|uniref:Uncharacterized protein n=1 Tax=Stylosanthes scabra TaxID=79078 RepID=A0ABU6S7H4_9FABA|nr:hypothetical protein [Stylosanthes scabra]